MNGITNRKRTVILVYSTVLTILYCTTVAQNLNYRDYMTAHSQVYSSIDTHYIAYYAELKIKRITETKTQYDSLGRIKYHSTVNCYLFDSLGRIMEHRYDYRHDTTKYRTKVYTYTPDGTCTIINVDPFGPDYVLDGFYVSSNMYMYCEYRNCHYQIEIVNAQPSINGNLYTMCYSYNPSLFIDQWHYHTEMLSGLCYYENDKLVTKHTISYEQWDK